MLLFTLVYKAAQAVESVESIRWRVHGTPGTHNYHAVSDFSRFDLEDSTYCFCLIIYMIN